MRISAVIRTYNEAHLLRNCLGILAEQPDLDVIVVDSYSTDNTVEIAEKYNARIIQHYPFTHGSSLNVGISASKNEYIAILSGHCFIRSGHYFERMLKHFNHDSKVAGVYARQIPSEKSNPIDKRSLLTIYREVPIRNYYFNNAASMIRKEVWDKHKFDETVEACEDILWARQVISTGYKILYEPKAVVEHLHEEHTETTIKRYEKEYAVLQKATEI